MEKKWLEMLTDDQKEKLRGLSGNEDELIAFCKQENLSIPDDLLDSVSGGERPVPGYGACPSDTSDKDSPHYLW